MHPSFQNLSSSTLLSPFPSTMASATSYLQAMARPAGQCALLKPPFPLLSLRARGVCLPSYAVSFSSSHTPLPANRFARFVVASAREDGSASEDEAGRSGDSMIPVGRSESCLGQGEVGNTLEGRSTGDSPASSPKANLIMTHSKLICCKMYISESRNTSAIAEIDQAASSDPRVVVLSKFGDYFYNRLRYTLISYIPKKNSSPAAGDELGSSTGLVKHASSGNPEYPMKDVLLKMMEVAFTMIDLKKHSGEHPRMGVIDDLSFHPLGDSKMKDAVELAKLMASEMGKRVPVFLYGEAHPKKKELGKIRRELGYYRPDSWWKDSKLPDILMRIEPDDGPTKPTNDDFLKLGATTVGAAPFLEGYNVPIQCEDVTKVRDIVTKLRAQLGGRGNEGHPKLLAIALPHGDGIVEVACLLDPNHVSANHIEDKVRQIAAQQGLGDKVDKGYFTDIPKDMILINLAI